ncbi:AraC family transcriptional regulator [Xanthobacter sp. V2C-8]|uniref:helix-turn-helix domain-containing protein n=1 Tax=Xanthobacter albus TaxID=3119929 RepID=UPI003728CC1C
MNGRTFARRLAVAETSFEDIKDDVRFAVDRDLLSLTDLPVGQISTALSYATPSALNHAFQRWTGTTPPEWRAAQGARSSGWKQTERD